MAFSLTSILNNRSITQDGVEEELYQDTDGEFKILDVLKLIPSKENFYSTQKKEEMKASIRVLGIEQPLRVEPMDDGNYKILAGHCRRISSLELMKEDEKFRWIPCYIKVKKSDRLSRLTLLLTNFTQRDPSEYEKMIEVTELEKEIKAIKEEEDIPGRASEILAKLIDMPHVEIGRCRAIKKHLNDSLMIAFKEGRIGKSIAYEASSLKSGNQLKLYAALNEKDNLSLADVRAFKKIEEEERKTIEKEEEQNTTSVTDEVLRECEKNVVVVEKGENEAVEGSQKAIIKKEFEGESFIVSNTKENGEYESGFSGMNAPIDNVLPESDTEEYLEPSPEEIEREAILILQQLMDTAGSLTYEDVLALQEIYINCSNRE